MSLQCAVIDDEPLARECMTGYIAEVDFLELAGVGKNSLDLSRLLGEKQIDVILLDIRMPVMNGIEFLRTAKEPPMVIITTAYSQYALEGYQLDVLDYLVKPVTFERFFKAVTKARDYHRLITKSGSGEDYFFIKCDQQYEKIRFEDILYIEAMQNYVVLYTTRGKFITLMYLKNVEERLDNTSFLRVHKSYLVAISKIEAIANNEIIIQNFRIPISRNYRDEVIEKVVQAKLWKK